MTSIFLICLALAGLCVPEVCGHPLPSGGPAVCEQYGESAGGEPEAQSVQCVFRQVQRLLPETSSQTFRVNV